MKKKLLLFLFFLASLNRGIGQGEPSPQELTDLTERVSTQIDIFLEYVTIIAAAEVPLDVRKRGIKLCIRNFAEDAIIEEQTKNSSYKRVWTPLAYLNSLLKRGESAPRIINFKVLDDLLPEELKKIKKSDGSVSYKGTMVVRQYYCTIDQEARYQEPTSKNPYINCKYNDTTDKEIGVEFTREESSKGANWITLISYVRVLRVY